MRFPHLTRSAVVLLAFAAACTHDRDPVKPPPTDPGTPKPPHVLGVYEITLTGLGTDQMSSSARAVASSPGDGPAAVLTPVTSGITLEAVSSSSFIEGTRAGGGQRYINFTFRVRNGSGSTINNVTLLPVIKTGTFAGTPISVLKKFDGTDVAASVAQAIVPTGAVALGSDLVTMHALYPDVIQVYTEAEVAAISPPAGVTSVFPYGFVVRSKKYPNSRTLPATSDPNQWDGLLTLAFRLPLQQPNNQADVFTVTFQFLVITDSETKLTESVEESQDTAARRRAKDMATALGATTVTVLNGSPAVDPAVPDYPGQRQICDFRTAGTAGAPLANNRLKAGYSTIMVLRQGETVDTCAAYFRGGTVQPPAIGNFYPVVLRAMDHYGNTLTSQVDTFHLTTVPGGAPNSTNAAQGTVNGAITATILYSGYGDSELLGTGKRLTSAATPLTVAGVLRTWTGAAGTTDWFTNGNWSPAYVPQSMDSVLVPGDKSFYPVLAANVSSITAFRMTNGASIQPTTNLGAFDLNVGGKVDLDTNGTFTGTTGRLILNGIASTVGGGVSNFDVRNMRVLGSYSASSNLNVTGGRIVVQGGRLRSTGFRVRVRPN